MKRRLISSLLAFALLSSLVISAAAAETRSNDWDPSLSFDGTTANCSVSIMAIGKSITASLELWRDNIRVAKWSDSATSYLVISEEHRVTSGETYTLKVSAPSTANPSQARLSPGHAPDRRLLPSREQRGGESHGFMNIIRKRHSVSKANKSYLLAA